MTVMKCVEITQRAGELIAGDRDRQHGDKRENFLNIACIWNAYLGWRLDGGLTPQDVAIMMSLMKISRTKTGSHNPDDYVDGVGYLAIAGDLAEKELELRRDSVTGKAVTPQTEG